MELGGNKTNANYEIYILGFLSPENAIVVLM